MKHRLCIATIIIATIITPFVIAASLSVARPRAQNLQITGLQITGPRHGALVLAGGGATIPEMTRRFVELGGGKACRFVVIPSAIPPAELTAARLEHIKQRMPEIFGVTEAVVLHARNRAEADTTEFVKPLQNATAVWFLGGDEDQLAELYAGTRTERELKALADRGGVVGGTSAGAMILSQFVDDPQPGSTNPFAKRRNAFDLLQGAMIVPHWSERDLRLKVVDWLTAHPGVLVIGIDETAAAIVVGSKLEVIGSGHIGFYDGKTHAGKPYWLLSPGEFLDLKSISVS